MRMLLKKKKIVQGTSILGILDETKQQHISVPKENGAINPLNSHFGDKDSFFNLSLSTIFSTRLEEDTNRKMINEDDAEDEKDQSESMFDSSQEKSRRPHPFPFTSPSYLKSLEKHRVPSDEVVTKHRSRKRTRSKKKKKMLRVKCYRYVVNLNIGQVKTKATRK